MSINPCRGPGRQQLGQAGVAADRVGVDGVQGFDGESLPATQSDCLAKSGSRTAAQKTFALTESEMITRAGRHPS